MEYHHLETDNRQLDCMMEPLVTSLSDNLQQQETDSDELMILQAVTFIEDASSYRSIHHRVDERALHVARIYNSAPVAWSRNIIIILLHLLAFLEFPSSLSWTSDLRTHDPSYEFPCGSLESIELFCLALFLVDVSVKIYLIGRYNALRSKWIVAYIIVLTISLIDWSVSIGLHCTEHVRVRRYLRPFFILQNSYLMKKMVNCLRRTLPEVASVLLLLALHIYMFTLIGMLLFPTQSLNETSVATNQTDVEGHEYFGTILKSLLNLLVLITTANNPDVTMPAYDRNRLYQIYFVLFLFIGLFCFMNMLTAVIYNQFRGYFLNSMQSSLFRRRVAIRATFEVLSQRIMSFRHSSTIPTMRSLVDVITLISVLQRCKVNKPKQTAMLEKLGTFSDATINEEQFMELFSILDMDPAQASVRVPDVTRWRYLAWLQTVVLHKSFGYIGILVAILNVILISVELSTQFSDSLGSKHSALRLINLIFIGYYLMEQSLKLWALGFQIYVSSKANIFDFFITVSLVVEGFLRKSRLRLSSILCCVFFRNLVVTPDIHGVVSMVTFFLLNFKVVEIFYLIEFGIPHLSNHGHEYVPSELADTLWNLVRLINILITVRLLRIIPHIKNMSVVASTLVDLIRSMKSFAGVLVAIYYVFAILGIELFRNRIKYSHMNATKLIFECGSYQQLQYWANNFDDFYAALVVLWDVMVVNNWHVFLEAYASITSRWSYLYFIFWWLLSVIIVLNLFTALILENFIMKWDKSHVRTYSQSQSGLVQSAQPLTLHDMFRDGLREPTDAELIVDLNQHRFLHIK